MIERVIPCNPAKLGYPSVDSRSTRLFLAGHRNTKFFLCGRGNAGVGGKSPHEIDFRDRVSRKSSVVLLIRIEWGILEQTVTQNTCGSMNEQLCNCVCVCVCVRGGESVLNNYVGIMLFKKTKILTVVERVFVV